MPHTVVSVLTTETSYFETQPGPSAPLNFLKIASGAPRRTYTDFLTLSLLNPEHPLYPDPSRAHLPEEHARVTRHRHALCLIHG